MTERIPELIVDGMVGEKSTNAAALRQALSPRTPSLSEKYSLHDLFGDVAKDLTILRAAAEHDPAYKRIARSLASVLAHERVGLSLRELSSALGITVHEAGKARRHAHVQFAGAAVERAVFSRVIKSEEVATHLAGHRVSHDVCRVREASMRNALSKVLLERNMPISQLYKLYVAECKKLNIEKPYKRATYYKYLGAAAFTDPKEESACCEICLEFIDETLAAIRKPIDDICLPLPPGETLKQLASMHKAIKASLKSGEFASHQQHAHTTTLMHDTFFALSDPHEPALAEDCDHEHEMNCAVCNGPLYLRTEMSAVVDWLNENTDIEKERITEYRENVSTLFGMRGLLRGMGHLVRDRRQSQYRIDIVRELLVHQLFMSDDYCSKLERSTVLSAALFSSLRGSNVSGFQS